jgi:hypothetical protein
METQYTSAVMLLIFAGAPLTAHHKSPSKQEFASEAPFCGLVIRPKGCFRCRRDDRGDTCVCASISTSQSLVGLIWHDDTQEFFDNIFILTLYDRKPKASNMSF